LTIPKETWSLSERKGLSDHHQVENPDPTHHFFSYFVEKNKLEQSQGEGLYPKDSTTITM